MNEQVRNIPVSQLYPFPNRPFKVRNDDAMAELCASLRDYGVLSPLIVRPFEEGFQVVSGHRRRMAAIILGLQELPSLVRVMSDDDAVILLVDSNIQRENLLPSEKAFAYKMKLEAIKRKAGRPPKDNLCQVGTNLIGVRSDHIIASNLNESARTVQRYIRLTYLETSILDLVDDGRIAFSPAVELSFLNSQEQTILLDIMQAEDCTPSLSQAIRLKKLSQVGQLDPERIFEIMSEEKANQKERIRIEVSRLRKYFPKSYTVKQMEETILRMLEANYQKISPSRDFLHFAARRTGSLGIWGYPGTRCEGCGRRHLQSDGVSDGNAHFVTGSGLLGYANHTKRNLVLAFPVYAVGVFPDLDHCLPSIVSWRVPADVPLAAAGFPGGTAAQLAAVVGIGSKLDSVIAWHALLPP